MEMVLLKDWLCHALLYYTFMTVSLFFFTGWCKGQGCGGPRSGEEVSGQAAGGQDSQENLPH